MRDPYEPGRALLIGLTAPYNDTEPVLRHGEILGVERDQFRAAECAGKAEEEQGAIAGAGQRVMGEGSEELTQVRSDDGRLLSRSNP